MTQTEGSITFRNAKVELSLDGSVWTDVSGSVSAVIVGGGERMIQEFVPLFSDATLAVSGTHERLTITVRSVYTENPQEARDMLQAAYAAGGAIGLRWTPSGGAAGARRYKAINALAKKPAFPCGEAGEANPLTAEYELSAESIDEEFV